MVSATKLLKKAEVLKSDLVFIAQASMDLDASGDIAISFPSLKEVVFAKLDIGAGYHAVFLSAALNVATFRVFWQDATLGAAGLLIAAANEVNLADSHAVAWGQ